MTPQFGFCSDTARSKFMMELESLTHFTVLASANSQVATRATTAVKSQKLGEEFDVITRGRDDENAVRTRVAWVTQHQFSMLTYIENGSWKKLSQGELISCETDKGALMLRDQCNRCVSMSDVSKRIVQHGIHDHKTL